MKYQSYRKCLWDLPLYLFLVLSLFCLFCLFPYTFFLFCLFFCLLLVAVPNMGPFLTQIYIISEYGINDSE